MSELTSKRLKELLRYDPITGTFTWLKKTGRKGNIQPGMVAGGPAGRGYLCIGIDGARYPAHRLAWLYMTGYWPIGDLDHKNTDRIDNRWCNLREVSSKSFNAENIRRAHKDNALGVLGVYRHGPSFRARIKASGKDHCLGSFSTIEAAHAAYLAAKRKLHAGNTL